MRTLSLAACLLAAFVTSSFAGLDDPTMDPASSPKKDPTGLNSLMKDRPKNAKTEITAKKEATFDNATSVAVFEGNVVVKDPQFTLFCDHLRVTLHKDHKGLQLVEATGNVIISQENKDENGKVIKSVGRAGKAVYEPDTGDITLTDWPSVQHDVNIQTATEQGTIMILNRSGKSTTKGPSKTSIIDTGDSTVQ